MVTLISDSLVLIQTQAIAALRWTGRQCVAWCACLPPNDTGAKLHYLVIKVHTYKQLA